MKPELTAQILGMYIGRRANIELKNYYTALDSDVVTPALVGYFLLGDADVTPHLRRLESITNKEANELHMFFYGRGFSGVNQVKDWIFFKFPSESNLMQDAIGHPAAWLYLLSKGFDLFGLIDAGLAEDVSE